MRNLILPLIKDKLQILSLFGAPWGSNGDQKGQKLPTSLKNSQKQKVCTGRWIFFHEKFDVVTYSLRTTIFDLLGGGGP